MLTTGIEWLRDTLMTEEGVTVTYARKEATVSLTAFPGQTPVEVSDDIGELVEIDRHIDWMLKPSDLVLRGRATLPKAGDTIKRTIDGTVNTYTVVKLPGEEVWRYSDEAKTIIRVHTVLSSDG